MRRLLALTSTFALCCTPLHAVRCASGTSGASLSSGAPSRRLLVALAVAGCPLGDMPRKATAADSSLLCDEEGAWREPAGPRSAVIDTQGWFGEARQMRLERILAKLEQDTGFRVRVATQRRGCPSRTQLADYWQLGRGKEAASNSNVLLLLADRGLAGRMDAGGTLFRFEAGAEVRLVLAQSFFAQLQREYGREGFVKANDEGAAIELACELALTCLRNEEYCTDVPAADSLGGMVL